jgi:hypothetical protein
VAERPQRVVTSSQLFRGHQEVVVGKVIIGLNVAAWVLMTVLSQNPYGAGGSVFENGALFGPLVATGEWWRLFSGAFLHAGIFHLGMNMLLLWFLSQELEPALGRLRFGLLYVVSLLGGSLGVMVLDPLAPTVGASTTGLSGNPLATQVPTRGLAGGVTESALSDEQPTSRLPDSATKSATPRALLRFMMYPVPP